MLASYSSDTMQHSGALPATVHRPPVAKQKLNSRLLVASARCWIRQLSQDDPLPLTSIQPSASTVVIVAEAFSPAVAHEDNVIYLVTWAARHPKHLQTCTQYLRRSGTALLQFSFVYIVDIRRKETHSWLDEKTISQKIKTVSDICVSETCFFIVILVVVVVKYIFYVLLYLLSFIIKLSGYHFINF